MGRWQTIEQPWYETRIVNCSLCGRMIARRMWISDGPEERVFCSEKCETLAVSFEGDGAATGQGDEVSPDPGARA